MVVAPDGNSGSSTFKGLDALNQAVFGQIAAEDEASADSEETEDVGGEDAPLRPNIEIFYKEFSITNRADGAESTQATSQGLDVSIDVE